MAKTKLTVIDVSDYQGRIDWEKVKKDGIDGAIIRAAYSTVKWDRECDRNIAECERLGIPFGLYIYSLAKTKKRARQEADAILEKAKGHKIDFPLYIDLEQAGYGKYAKEMAEEFGRVIEKAGYWCGVYANQSWWLQYLRGLNRFTKWVAWYGAKPTVEGTDMWQYTSAGKVDGISGHCDKNKCYRNFPKLIEKKRKVSASHVSAVH